MPCSIIGICALNDFVLSRGFSPSYKVSEGNNRGGFSGFLRDILIEYGLFGDAHSRRHDRSTLNQTGINISVDKNLTDPFVHACMTFNIVKDISRQKKCVMCLAEVRKKAMSLFCGLCIILSHLETDRHPSCHA